MTSFKDDVLVREHLDLRLRSPGGGGGGRRIIRPGGAPPIRVESNVRLQLKTPGGFVEEEREDHNIFVNYGRDWLAQLIALDTGGSAFRTDRVRYMAFGIGGTSQQVDSDTIRNTYAGFPNQWVAGTGGTGDPAQTDTDPTVLGLEWPVLIAASDYYDDVSQPATFPDTGVVRFTTVVGVGEISFGSYASVPLSEIGLFTQSVGAQSDPPTTAVAPADKYMVAYNTFDTLSKTPAFVLQVDWELRFS